eukprot:TRINITY_DN72324_c0_g1_i1.p1 TRINITY_DN72324_c0_g1~~TRINITY_DN72324_c0_g1_i1.p1  ORF type:complete len:265 (-),score=25.27 TRINITY_DN72324_c0_g1_i1:323-1117(-)
MSMPRFERQPVVSELFDASAFVPEPLNGWPVDSERTGEILRGWCPSRRVPTHDRAGFERPLLDVVELCHMDETVSTSTEDKFGLQDVATLAARAHCPDAEVVRDRELCAAADIGSQNDIIMPHALSGNAAVKCCWDEEVCVPYWVIRNRSFTLAACLPQQASFFDALRVCKALGAKLCSAEGARNCCGRTCEGGHELIWLASQPAQECVDRVSTLRENSRTRPMNTVDSSSGVAYEAVPVEKRPALFLRWHEEARSTRVTWLEA